jgi:hypothetical protein
MKKVFLVITLCAISSQSMVAQTTNSNPIQPKNGKGIDNSSRSVFTQFEPKLIPSSKLLIDPIVPKSENPKINYKIETPEYHWITSKIARPVQPERLRDRNSDTVYQSNYIRLGGGNYGHLLGELYLANKAASDYSYNLSVQHLNANPANSIREFSTSRILAQGAKYFRNSSLDTRIFYNRFQNNYFAKDSAFNGDILTLGKIAQNYGLGIGYNYLSQGKSPSFAADLVYNGFQNNFMQREMDVTATGNLRKRFKEAELGLLVGGTYLSQNQRVGLRAIDSTAEYNQIFTDIRPTLSFGHKATGLKVIVSANSTYWTSQLDTIKDSKFYVAPYLNVSKDLNGLKMKLYGVIDGGLQKNTFRHFQQMVPFTHDSIEIRNSFEQINVYGGIQGKLNEQVYFNLDFGFNSVSDMPLVVSNGDSLNSLKIIYDDVNSTYVKTNIQYSMGDKLKIQARIRLADYSPTSQSQAWHLPSFSYSSRLTSSLGNSIELTAGFDGVGNRFNRISDGSSFKTVKVPGYFDLFGRADYRVLGKGRIWIQASNILSGQYQQWYGYKNYGLTVMGGLTIALF